MSPGSGGGEDERIGGGRILGGHVIRMKRGRVVKRGGIVKWTTSLEIAGETEILPRREGVVDAQRIGKTAVNARDSLATA